MAEKNDVVFRRIGGRIVPIKLSKRKKQALEGAGLTAAGVGAAALGGSGLGRIAKIGDTKIKIGRKLPFDFGVDALIPGAEAAQKGQKIRKVV